jgi:hypothetical protein
MQHPTPITPTADQIETWKLGRGSSRSVVIGFAALVLGCLAAWGLLSKGRDVVLAGHALLVVVTFYLSITLGALFFVMLHHLSRAGWSVTVRRLAEAVSANLLWLAPVALLTLAGLVLCGLYPWAPASAFRDGPPLRLPAAKAGYLNPTAFTVRMALYFAVWAFLAWYFRSRSLRQDRDGDVRWSLRMERMSAPGMIAFAMTITLAAVDLLMSLNPHWSSTMIGVYFFSGSVVAGLVALMLLAVWLQAAGKLQGAITVEHYHDLGKLTFAFTVFWGYIAFSQYMLIWYANMPEETQFFLPRQIGPWAGVSLALLFCHLLIPLFGLMSRYAKRHPLVFTFWAVWLLAAHLLDVYWLVMPNVFIREIPRAVGLPPDAPLPEALGKLLNSNHSVYQLSPEYSSFMDVVRAPLGPAALGMTLALTAAVGGLFLVGTIALLRRRSLVPLQDPRLDEALQFENI